MTREIPRDDSATAVDPDHLLAVFDPASDDPIAQKIMDVVRAVVPVHSLRAFQAAADGTEGAAIGVPVSHNGDFDVVANLPANSKWGFELAAGRVLVGVFNANGRNEMNRFTQAGQVWTLTNAIARRSDYRRTVRTAPAP